MKLSIALLSGVLAVSAATPHSHHGHKHLHKDRRADNVIVVPGPTIMAYILDGNVIGEDEVQQGIKNGSLVFAKDGKVSHAEQKAPKTSAPASTSTSTSSSSSSSTSSSSSVAPSTSAPAPVAKAPAPQPKASSSNPHAGGLTQGLDRDFPDGQIDCSHFPSDYGAMAVDYMGLEGWIGVQQPKSNDGGLLGDILTVTKAMLGNGGACSEGSFCSYACPAGYQKSQWPASQGKTGQSIGGIKCENGKLHLTNSALSNKLCIPGAQQVTVLIENHCGSNVPVCRTDYPGTEAETVPLDTQPGSTNNLTCPDGGSYYHHEGAKTSAQYYVNPQGTPVSEGCIWGDGSKPVGNSAPVNLGVGYSAGAAWLSIFQNAPTTQEKLDFPIELQMNGAGVSGTCRYSNGQYCGGANFGDCSSTTGCTVSLTSGTAKFVLCPGK